MRPFNIIIEGPDNVGKSTLIQGLKKVLTAITFHELHYSAVRGLNSEQTKLKSKHYYEQMFKLLSSDINFIVDRSHIGEYVYGPMYRGYLESDLEVYTEMEQAFVDNLDSPKTIIIYLEDSVENLVLRDDGLSISNAEQHIKMEMVLFKAALEERVKLPYRCVRVSDSPEETLEEVLNMIEELV